MTDQMKEKMMKVIIDDGGHIEFITPKGERMPSVVGAEIEWNYSEGGLITAKVTFHAYMDNKKSIKEDIVIPTVLKEKRLIPSDRATND